MIRFAPQTTERAASSTRTVVEPKVVAASAGEPASETAGLADGSMLLAELPEVTTPGKANAAKTRTPRKPKTSPELPVAQLTLDA